MVVTKPSVGRTWLVKTGLVAPADHVAGAIPMRSMYLVG
jgi:hypothetical protein